MAHDVFLSYSSKDKPAADAVCSILERHDIRCWMAPRDIQPGREWAASIIEAIKESRVFVVVFSAHANASVQVGREIERAIARGIPVLSFRIEDVTPSQAMEYYLSTPHWMDAFPPPMDRHFEQLAYNVATILGLGASPPPPPPPRHRLAKPAALTLVVVLTAAFVLCGAYYFWSKRSGGGLASCDKPAESPETAANRLSSFVYYSPETPDKNENRRSWSRPESDVWIEQSMRFTNYFNVDGRAHLPYCDGTIVSKKTDASLQLFLPDKDCKSHFLEFRRRPSCDWILLPGMEEIQ